MDQLVALLGQPSEVGLNYLRLLGSGTAVRNWIDNTGYVEAPSLGVSFVLDANDRVTAAQLHAEAHEGFTQWMGPMPDGVAFSCGRSEVRRVLGKPEQSGEPKTVPVLGPMPAWDRFPIHGAVVHFEYDPDPERGVRMVSVLSIG